MSQLNNDDSRIAYFDQMRALAILPVMIGHYLTHRPRGGWLGVYLFFCLSGFFITRLLYARNVQSKIGVIQFLIRRVFRIYPLYLFTLLLTAFLMMVTHSPMLMELFRLFPASLTFYDFPNCSATSNFGFSTGVMWTLQVEFWFYVTFAMVFALCHRYRRAWLSIPIVFVFCLFLQWQFPELERYFPSYWRFATKGSYLLVGSVLAFVTDVWKLKSSPRLSWGLFTVSLLTVFYAYNKYPANDAPFWASGTLLTTICAAILIWHHENVRPAIKIPLLGLALTWTGELSYSLYLMHGLLRDFAINRLNNVFSFLIACYVLSFLTYRLIEKPGITCGRRLANSLKRDPLPFPVQTLIQE